MAGRLIPPELMPQIGICLRQARAARSLSLAKAAGQIGIEPGRLDKIELGQEQITDLEAQFIIARYGEARADRLTTLLFEWNSEEAVRKSKTEQRKHLSIVGDEPKPWERVKRDWK